MYPFTEKDIEQIQNKGLTPEIVNFQINNFIEGFPYVDLVKPARTDDSIESFEKERVKELVRYYEKASGNLNIVKFVPASGAASRMFKDLFTYLNDCINSERPAAEIIKDESHKNARRFINHLEKFAFYDELRKTLGNQNLELEKLRKEEKYDTIIDYVISPKGLNYGQLPKALILFHKYDDHARLALEEHLVEGAYYAKNKNNKVSLHFTVSPEHLEQFKETINKLLPSYESHFGVEYKVSYSKQKESTDIIAVDMDNEPIRLEDGSLLFRPGGHGALIQNLNDIYGDLIFIKNIDNVVPDHLRDTTYIYKKVIGGYLLEIQKQVFNYLQQLNDNPEYVNLEEVRDFIQKKLGFKFRDQQFHNLRRVEKIDLLFDKLNRPIRVCGMVKNQGDPGGGPFCVRDKEGNISLQIVEKAQIDTKKEDQRNYLESASHFNPVDLVCSIKNFKGEPFDLTDFVDPKTGLISHKTKDGTKLKAQELPGLWNGAMADWNTIFVEVPIITFNPVKTINDLLRKEHQPKE